MKIKFTSQKSANRGPHKLAPGQSYCHYPYDRDALLASVSVPSVSVPSVSVPSVAVRLPWYVRLWNWIKSLFKK